jgi:hypothetical protein
MSKFKTLVMFTVLTLISVIMLFGINRVQNQLDSCIEKNNLRYTGQIRNAPPIVIFTTVALGSFRGLLADLLWLRATRLQDKGNYFEMVQLANWITKLQPRFSGATAYLAWNMAYNISVTCSSFADRWRWVQEGIKLIRDEALEYNPEDPSLYKELGWIFQHKLGNIMDDANLYYKNKLAIAMMEVFGKEPNWPKMAAAPSNYKDFLRAYPDKKDSPFWTALRKAGYDSYDALYKDFKDSAGMPEKFLKALNNPKLAEDLDIYFRATWLREKYKLDSRLIEKINQKYGDLDWRLAESQAIYWATKGLEMTPSHRDISCERMITQALFASFKSGRLLTVDVKDFASIITVPNLQVVDAVKRTFEEAYIKNNKQSSFRSAMINFMKDAIVILYNYGAFSKSKEYYQALRKEEPGQHRQSLEAFVMKQWAEDVRDASVKKATDAISGLLYRSYYYMVYGDMDAALAHEKIARYIYITYQRANADVRQRVGLAPYSKLKEAVVQACLKNFPPVMAEILRAKVEEDKTKAKAAKEAKEKAKAE